MAPTPATSTHTSSPFRLEWALFVLSLVAFGVGLRLWRLGALPVGLYQDEAIHGLDALAGLWRWYYPANNGREPLFVWLVTLSVQALGPTALALRLPAALIGIATLPAAGLLGAVLVNRRVGWWSAAVAAGTFWLVALSRVSFRAVTLPLLLALAVALGWWAVRERHWPLALASGGLYGLSFYTYSAARFTPLVLALWGVWALWLYRNGWRNWPWRALIAFAAGTLLAGLPLIGLAATNYDLVFGRLGQVAVTDPLALLRQTGAALLMFVIQGDTIGRHNLPGRPVFDLLLALPFLAGLLILARRARARDLAAGLLLAWSLGMLGPTLLADDAPHFLRAVGVLPAILVVAAVGLDALVQRMDRRWGGPLALVLLSLSALWTAYDYFGRYAAEAETGVWFQQAAQTLSAEALADPAPIWIDTRLWDSFPSVRYLLAARDDVTVFRAMPPEGWPPASETQLIVWPYVDFTPALQTAPIGMAWQRTAGAIYREERTPPASAYPLYTRFHLAPAPQTEPLAVFGGQVALLAVQPGDGGVATLWQTVAPVSADYHIFVHGFDADGQLLAVADGPPLAGDYPFSDWPVGAMAWHPFAAMPIQAGAVGELRIGLYDPVTGVRLTYREAGGEYDAWTQPAPVETP